MVYKRFYFRVIIHIGLLLANMVCLAYSFARTDLFFTQLILLFLLIFQVYHLIHFVLQTNRELAKFLLALKHTDYSVTFNNHTFKDPAFNELSEAFSQIIGSYQQVNAQKESQYEYFKRIVEQVNVGIISLKGNHEIALMNKAAHALLSAPEGASWPYLQANRNSFTNAAEAESRGGNRLVEIKIGDEMKQLSLRVDDVLLLGRPYHIIIFQDIRQEIEQKEMEAWYKLIRILTHEIMNSVTPVASLTETMLMILGQDDGRQKELASITEENIADLRFSLKTIQNRSNSLLHFLNDYRKLTRIPVPQLEEIKIAGLLAEVATLMQGELHQQQVRLSVEIADGPLVIQGDYKLLAQVLINLITNSLQALEAVADANIVLKAYHTESKVIVEVSDNGAGIDEDKMDKIFIPFYSTKAEGSGIGLSLSKQIVNLHKGTIKVYSRKGMNTTFQLVFIKTIKHSL